MKPILLVDFGSTYTKVVAVDVDAADILGTAKSFTTVESDITIGLKNAKRILDQKIGVLDYAQQLGCSSAAGGLKMVAIGLVPELTSKAAKTAALSAGAKVIKTYSYRMNDDEVAEIEAIHPDILLLSGGTDGGNEDVVIHNARLIAASEGVYPVIYAGNKSAVSAIKEIFLGQKKDLIVTSNVMPSMDRLETDAVKNVISDLFLSRIIEAKGLNKAEMILDNILMPTPSAVMLAAELLSRGTRTQLGIGDLMVVDMGGATTDIHSACEGYPSMGNIVLKGLREPYMKRTVEGDLGARYSLRALIDSVGMDLICYQLGWDVPTLEAMLVEVEAEPGRIAEPGTRLDQLDQLSAKVAIAESTKRHSGTMTSHYTPFGEMFEQVGKDLTKVSTVIGTGGPIIHHDEPIILLQQMVFSEQDPMSLRPKAPTYYSDQLYIMAAMGLLSIEYPEVALTILKKYVQQL